MGFFANGKLLKVPVTGGVPQTICRVPTETAAEGADWAAGGTIVFAVETRGLWRVSASGGTPQAVTTLDNKKGELDHFNPQVLPGGKAVLFTVQGPGVSEFHIAVESLETHERHDVAAKGELARYATSGHLVYAWEGSLLARPFDLQSLEVTGPEAAILASAQGSSINFALSTTGTLVYALSAAPAARSLVWVDRLGKEKPLQAPKRIFFEPRLSADGKRLAVSIDDGQRADIWTYDLARDVFAPLTYDGMSASPAWGPDDKRLVFSSWRAGPVNIFMQAADGTGLAERLLPSRNNQWTGSWSPDGSRLAFMEFNGTTLGDILVLPRQGKPEPQPILQVPATQWGGRISPDGRWLAYVSDESGRFEVYVTSFPSGQGKWQLSTDGGTEVVWARNGRELYWRQGDIMMAAGTEATAGFAAAKSKPLFAGYMRGLPGLPAYDVSRDGRFLMVKGTAVESTPAQLNVVLNWFEELRSKVGAAKR